jgi:transcriptional regulator with XRE-family HTH domain
VPSSTHSTGSTKDFRDWLSGELEQRGWSHARLARELDLFKGTVGRWLMEDNNRMQRRPAYESCRRLANLFGKDIRQVLEMAGIDNYERDKNLSDLQREVQAIVALIPDPLLVVVQPQLQALIDEGAQARIVEKLHGSRIRESDHLAGRN